jgi:ATP-dependent Clp protease, protease subunit
LIHILANHSGKTEEQVAHDSDRDYWMSAEEAKAYGLVDEVVRSRKDVPAQALPVNGDSVLPA